MVIKNLNDDEPILPFGPGGLQAEDAQNRAGRYAVARNVGDTRK